MTTIEKIFYFTRTKNENIKHTSHKRKTKSKTRNTRKIYRIWNPTRQEEISMDTTEKLFLKRGLFRIIPFFLKPARWFFHSDWKNTFTRLNSYQRIFSATRGFLKLGLLIFQGSIPYSGDVGFFLISTLIPFIRDKQ